MVPGGATARCRRAEPACVKSVLQRGLVLRRTSGVFSTQLVPAGKNGGGWGGVSGASGRLVHPAVEENFRPGCQRGDHSVRTVRVRGGKGTWDVHWLSEPGTGESKKLMRMKKCAKRAAVEL